MKLPKGYTPILTEDARSVVWIILPKLQAKRGECRVCGCDDEHACMGGCSWVDRDHTLCTACMPPVRNARTKKGRSR